MKRLFIATKHHLHPSHLTLLNQLKQQMLYDNIIWVDTELQHITLRFLGATPEHRIPVIEDLLDEVALTQHSFQLAINKLGVFGSRYAPSVVWLGFDYFDPYLQLFNMVENKLLSQNFVAAYGNVVPHITLGRIKKIDNKKRFWSLITKYQSPEPQTIVFDELTLFQSKLTAARPIYRALKTIKFKK